MARKTTRTKANNTSSGRFLASTPIFAATISVLVRLGKGVMGLGALLATAGVLAFALPIPFVSLHPLLESVFVESGFALFIAGVILSLAGQRRPHLVLSGTRPFYVETVDTGLLVDILCMRVRNESRRFTSRIALGLSATLHCRGHGSESLPVVTAVWFDATQPLDRPPEELPRTKTDLGVGCSRQVYVAIKDLTRADCFLFGRESLDLPAAARYQNPDWRLGPGPHRVVITLTGEQVNERFECGFVNLGRGGSIEIMSYRSL